MQVRHTIQSSELILGESPRLAEALKIALAEAQELGVSVDVFTTTSTRIVITATAMPDGTLLHVI